MDCAKTVLEALIGARAILAAGWCQGTMFKRADGTGCGWEFRAEAVSYCPRGALAITECSTLVLSEAECAVLRAVGEDPEYRSISGWNDRTSTTHQMVLDGFDAAIRSARDAN